MCGQLHMLLSHAVPKQTFKFSALYTSVSSVLEYLLCIACRCCNVLLLFNVVDMKVTKEWREGRNK